MTAIEGIIKEQIKDLKDGNQVKLYHKSGENAKGTVQKIKETLFLKKENGEMLPIIADRLNKIHTY